MASKKVLKEQTIERIRRYKNEYSTVKEFKQSDEYQSLVNGFMNGYEREHSDSIIEMVYDGKSYDNIRKAIQKMEQDIERDDVTDKKSDTSETFFMASQGKVVEVDPVYVIIGDDESDDKDKTDKTATEFKQPNITVDQKSEKSDDEARYAAFWSDKETTDGIPEKVSNTLSTVVVEDNKSDADILLSEEHNDNPIFRSMMKTLRFMCPNTFAKYYGEPKAPSQTMLNFNTVKTIVRSVLSEVYKIPEDRISDNVIAWFGNDIIESCYDKFDISGTFTEDAIRQITKVIRKWVAEHETSVKEAIAS